MLDLVLRSIYFSNLEWREMKHCLNWKVTAYHVVSIIRDVRVLF